MMRQVNGLGWVLGGLFLSGLLVLVGCTPPPAVMEKTTRTDVGTAPIPPELVEAGLAASRPPVLEVRELKIIEDNGQQGVFAKLSRAPREVSHYTLSSPNRLVIEMLGDTSGELSAEQYPIDNPLIEQIRVGRDQNKIRVTITLRGAEFPEYTVDDLNDTLVAFLGEPHGTSSPVHEQLVFTQRPVPGAARPGMQVARSEEDPPAAASAGEAGKADSAAAAGDEAKAQKTKDVVRIHGSHVTTAPKDETMTESDSSYAVGAGAKQYYGQPVSLDLKDADIHNVLRLLADVSNLNIVATDDVKGNITLRLFDVPWDQALDIILQVMNLESVQDGNVVRISTVKRLREEREELHKAQQAAQIVEPLQVAYIRVNYAKAAKLGELVSGTGQQLIQNRTGRNNRSNEADGVLSPRGSVLVDEFTNTLIVRDISSGIRNARELVRRLDIQIPQVLIESNIVEATTDFSRELGIQWGYRNSTGPQTGTSTGSNFPGIINFAGGPQLNTGTGGVPFLVDFPAKGDFAAGAGSALDLALGSLDGQNSLDLQLTALEQQGKGRIISKPRVVTLNNVAATIKSLTILRVRLPSTGTVINTGAGGAAGGQSTATEKIETGIILTVTPQVSSDGFVLLDMFAKSSQADFSRTVDNIPTEITREATSHLLVRDGQTVVLGGIYRDTLTDNTSGLPFLSTIPGLKWLFRSESKSKRREDLLVFLTPRVITSARSGDKLPSAAELWQNRGDNIPQG
jgi:type IV pilus secretin PilQ/predicted competence protein